MGIFLHFFHLFAHPVSLSVRTCVLPTSVITTQRVYILRITYTVLAHSDAPEHTHTATRKQTLVATFRHFTDRKVLQKGDRVGATPVLGAQSRFPPSTSAQCSKHLSNGNSPTNHRQRIFVCKQNYALFLATHKRDFSGACEEFNRG